MKIYKSILFIYNIYIYINIQTMKIYKSILFIYNIYIKIYKL